MSGAPPALEPLLQVLRTMPIRFGSEADLQSAIAASLSERLTWRVVREVRLSGRDRVDVAVEVTGWPDAPGPRLIVIEVKTAGAVAEIERQIARYATHLEVVAVVLVTTRMQHARMPAKCGGKPVATVLRLPMLS